MIDELCLKATVFSAVKYKLDGHPLQPLDDGARVRIQKAVDRSYGMFVRDVAKGRGVSEAAVRGGFGEGASVGADEALSLGMVTRIATLDETLERIAAQPPALTPVRASVPAAAARRLPAATFTPRTVATGRQDLARAIGR
jgi:ClpP class serine protease